MIWLTSLLTVAIWVRAGGVQTLVTWVSAGWTGLRISADAVTSLGRLTGLVASSLLLDQLILMSVINTAIGYSPAGSVVRVEVREGDQDVEVRVIDHGPGVTGIAPERVFERFAHGAAAPSGGSTRTSHGIGLALDWSVSLATDLRQARGVLSGHLFAAAVIDRRLPDGDGADLVAWMRRRVDATPVLLLTALGTTTDKVDGLDAGANDHLVKPFEFDVLNARLRALTRDCTAAGGTIPIGSWSFCPHRHAIDSPDTGRILLTERESSLLAVLAAHPDTAFSRPQLLSAAFDAGDQLGTVDTDVHHLRRKTERGLIETVRGVGDRSGTSS